MSEQVYRELQQRLDKYSLGFPATDTGIEIAILKELFTPDDAVMFLNLTPILETPDSVAVRLGKPPVEVAARLEGMAKRGLLFRLQKGAYVKYGAIPFVHGLFEFQVKRLGNKLADLMESYFQAGFKKSMAENAGGFLRTIPIQESLEATQNIAAYEDACEILKAQKLIVVADCICRTQKKLIGKGCGKMMEACFMFGSMAQYYLDHELGRQVEVDEAIRILRQAQDAGLVTQPATAQNPGGMCNCCGDCCGLLNSLRDYPRPAELVSSNFFAIVDEETCIGCDACIDRCQMDAVKLNDAGCAIVDLERCIGCGLCVTTCPSDSVRLLAKAPEKRSIPPVTGLDQMLAMAEKRGIQF
ncbi:MAG: 4Fe-4S binding protein [Smithellaceae bacterium]|nr:4Fe-4S binding protein [Smithellaceae bacterium]